MAGKPDTLTVATSSWSDHVAIARPDHWFKNIFMLPGAALAWVLLGEIPLSSVAALAWAVVATCLIASANYTINEWLDAESDRHHPLKRHRPSAAGRVRAPLVYLQWLVLAGLGLTIAAYLGASLLLCALALLVMGLVYNVKPFRTKDRPYLDVLSEAVNNPLRFLLGWTAIVGDVVPPSSILLAYWMGGAYLMATKRFAEYRYLGGAARAEQYRLSFRRYSEATLLVSAFFYALCSAFFLGVFLVKYRIEFLLCMPFLALLFAWYLMLGLRAESPAQHPERLYRETPFVAYVVFLALLIGVLFFVDLPWLHVLVESHAVPRS